MDISRRRFVCTLATAALGASVGIAAAAKKTESPQSRYRADDETVELFAGIKSGQLNVKFVPQNARVARIIVTNKSDQPLNVRLPETFAGAPVLAQFGQNLQGIGQNGAQGQTIGGGVFNNGGGNQGGNQFGNQQGGNFFMNIAPERFDDVEVATVCLEYGKPDPRPAMAYEIKPLEEHTTKTAVHELIRELARGDVSQDAAQAAAWHLENGMSWDELAALKLKRQPTLARPGPIPLFHPRELAAARRLVAVAEARARASQESRSPGESLSQDR